MGTGTRLRFAKMQGQGNDFMVVDAIRQPGAAFTPQRVKALADRHFGIGFDQLLVVEPARTPGTDFRYRIFNADGDEVEQCGNGARCFARFVLDEGLTRKHEIRVETASGIIAPRVEASGRVTVDMGAPRFEPADIPFTAAARRPLYTLEVGGAPVELSVLSMGNPHAVQVVEDVE